MEQAPHKSSSDTHRRKRKRTHYKVHNSINDLPDDILITILSRLTSRIEATKTSVLSRRWRYLWRSLTTGFLELDNRHMFSDARNQTLVPGTITLSKKMINRVNHALKSHRRLPLDGLAIRFSHFRSLPPLRRRCKRYIDKWIHFALRREVKTLELSFSMHIRGYEFPSRDLGSFASLRSLTLMGVDIRDKVVHYFLASCPFLQQLCIRRSRRTKNLRVVGPLSPNLKVLEISKCGNLTSLQVSAMNLVSCTYRGDFVELPFLDTPNLSELTLGGDFARYFYQHPNEHDSTYSVQLVKLTLDLEFFWTSIAYPSVRVPPLHSLQHFELNIKSKYTCTEMRFFLFTSLIKAAPLLNEFKIEVFYASGGPWRLDNPWRLDKKVGGLDPELRDCHKNLKAVKMSGYVGCSCDDSLILYLLQIAPSVEMVTIDTEVNYPKKDMWPSGSGAETRIEAIERAQKLSSSFPPNTVLIVT